MDITYLGANCIQLQTKKANLVIDPYDTSYGLPKRKLKNTIELYSNIQAKVPEEEDMFYAASPGEYEVQGFSVQGIAAHLHVDDPEKPGNGVIYRITAGGIRLLVTGNIAPKLSEEAKEIIGDIDIMILPVGGRGLTLDSQAASTMVTTVDPRVIMPIHYDDGKTTYPMPQEKLELFLKEIGIESPITTDKYSAQTKNLPLDESEVVVLEVAK